MNESLLNQTRYDIFIVGHKYVVGDLYYLNINRDVFPTCLAT